jgi:hypothetical protein
MNQFFSLKRFTLLLQLHWQENRRFYIMGWLVLLAIGILIPGLIFITSPTFVMTLEIQMIFFYVGLYLFLGLLAARSFSVLGSKQKCMHYLSIPASQFEKFMVGFFVTVAAGFIAYVLAFYIMDIIFVGLSHNRMANLKLDESEWRSYYNRPRIFNFLQPVKNLIYDAEIRHDTDDIKEMRAVFFSLYSGLVAACGYFAFGSAGFGKNSFIKSIILFFLIGCVYFLVSNMLIGSAPEPFDGFLYGLEDWSQEYGRVEIKQKPWIWNLVVYGLTPVMGLLLWMGTYYRIKEKQV